MASLASILQGTLSADTATRRQGAGPQSHLAAALSPPGRARTHLHVATKHALPLVRAPPPAHAPPPAATAVLDDAQKQAGFAIALLRLAEDAAADLTTRQSAALLFKNFVKRNWKARRGTRHAPAAAVTPARVRGCPPTRRAARSLAVPPAHLPCHRHHAARAGG